MLFLAVTFLAVSLTVAQTQCSAAGNIGPCFNGVCPAGSCINQGTPNEACCTDVTTAPPPPTVPVVTTVPPVTTTARITVITVPTTVGSTACVDKLNPNTGVSDCPGMASYCNNPTYYSLMTTQCPFTCGRCNVAAATTVATTACVDKLNPNTGVSDCPGMQSYCTNPTYTTVMAQQCPKTCGLCSTTATGTSSTTCADLLNPTTGVSDCPSRASLCNNATYYNLMTTQCPKTCGRCSSSTGTVATGSASTTCVDQVNPSTGVSNCPTMAASGYCSNAAYATLMTQQCPLSCGRCTGK